MESEGARGSSTDLAKRGHGNTQTEQRDSGSCCVSTRLGREQRRSTTSRTELKGGFFKVQAYPKHDWPPTTHHQDGRTPTSMPTSTTSTPQPRGSLRGWRLNACPHILPHCCTAKHPPTSGQEGGSGPHPGHPRQSWWAIEMPPSGQHEHHSGTPVESETNRDCLSLSAPGTFSNRVAACCNSSGCCLGLAGLGLSCLPAVGGAVRRLHPLYFVRCVLACLLVCMPCSSIIAGNCGSRGESGLQIDQQPRFLHRIAHPAHPAAPIDCVCPACCSTPFHPEHTLPYPSLPRARIHHHPPGHPCHEPSQRSTRQSPGTNHTPRQDTHIHPSTRADEGAGIQSEQRRRRRDDTPTTPRAAPRHEHWRRRHAPLIRRDSHRGPSMTAEGAVARN